MFSNFKTLVILILVLPCLCQPGTMAIDDETACIRDCHCDRVWPCKPMNFLGAICGYNEQTKKQQTFANKKCLFNTKCKNANWSICHLSACQVGQPLSCNYEPEEMRKFEGMQKDSVRGLSCEGLNELVETN